MVVTDTVVAGVSAPYHAAQTGVDVQIVSDRVTQFSGQLNALSFECAVNVVAFVRHTAQPVVTHFETEVRVNLITTERTSAQLAFVGRTIVIQVAVVPAGVMELGPTQFTTCIPVLSFGAACATVAKPASATAIAIAVFFSFFCASLSSKIRHEGT